MRSYPEFIPAAGASLATKSVMSGTTEMRWLDRKSSQSPVDNGWRVLGASDTGEYLADNDNWQVVDFNELCAMEPALLAIWNLPVGSQLTLVTTSTGQKVFIDDATGAQITADEIYGAAPGSDPAPTSA